MSYNPEQIASRFNENTVDIGHYRDVLMRYKWRILAGVAIATTLAFLISTRLQPVYRATNTVLIENHEANVVAIKGVYSMNPAAKEYYLTQIELLKSRKLAERLLTELDLTNHPDFDPRQTSRQAWYDRIPGIGNLLHRLLPEHDETALTDAAVAAATLARVSAALAIEPVNNTQLVKINFDSHDPELAARAANTMAEVYIESTLESRLQITRQAAGWLTDRLDNLAEKLKESEARLQEYREQETLVEIAGVNTLNAKELSELTQQYVAAQNARSQVQNAYEQIRGLGNDPPLELLLEQPGILQQDLVKTLRSHQVEADRNVAELSKRYGPRHPLMIAARTEADEARTELKRQVLQVARSIRNQYDMAQETERAIAAQLGKAKQSAQSVNRKEFRLSELEREVESNRQLYDMFLNRAKETSESNGLEPALARVVDAAAAPRLPVFPNTRLIVLLTFAGSLGLGVVLAFLRDAMDNSIQSPEELEDRLHIRMLGFLPNTRNQRRDLPLDGALTTAGSHFAEAVRSLRTGLLLTTTPAATPQIVLVTSSLPGEGKSTVALNLAEALGQMEKVLLIEADLRRPSLARALGIDPLACGLADMILDARDVKECIQAVPERGIHTMVAGVPIPDPQECLSSRRYYLMLDVLKRHYDRIVIDSPPTQLVSDALLLSTFADGVIYVVKAGETPVSMINQGINRLRHVRAPLLGTVLNRVDTKLKGHYGGYYAGYPPYAASTHRGATKGKERALSASLR